MISSKPKILLVEDEPPVAKLFQFTLQREGFEVAVATNGKEGIELAKKEIFDLILSDIMMPVIDGYQFRKLILEESHLRNIPFVFLTAKGSEDDILSGYDLGIDEYIIKTSPPKIVIAKLKAILAAKKKRESEVVEELTKAVDSLGSRVVPDSCPELETYKIKHWHKPFKDTPGGDFIDYIEIDENNLLVVLGDVMGKKWNAWYFALPYAGYIRSSVRVTTESSNEISPAKILEQVNKTVYKDERISEIFTTISIVLINKSENFVQYAGAGDLPLLLKSNLSGQVEKIFSPGLLLGFSETSEYSNVQIKLDKDDQLYLFTDGIIEAENQNGEFLGLDNFIDLLSKNNSLKEIETEMKNYTASNFSDDLSLIQIQKV